MYIGEFHLSFVYYDKLKKYDLVLFNLRLTGKIDKDNSQISFHVV